MPKMKTRKSAAKRFKGTADVSETDMNRVSSQLPYKKYLR